jgi:uncharacterized iron-regulated membrane protein
MSVLNNSRSVSPATASLYRTIWRWHFFAGLLVLPFLVMMAITGGAYLFKPELDHFIYRALEDVPERTAPFARASEVVKRVEAELNARVLDFTPSIAPNRSVRLLVKGPTGEPLTVFANPYDGKVIGSTAYGGVMQLVRKIHSLQRFGFWASCMIELAAGWSIILVGTGLYLWWPRGASAGGVVTVRGSPRHRVFWRDLHAITGLLACSVILFLAATGMPWSMFWGAHVQNWATAANLNKPAPPAGVTPEWMMAATMPDMPDMPDMPHSPHAADKSIRPEMPWAMEAMQPPMSHDTKHQTPISVDRAVDIFRQLGVNREASIALPEGSEGAYAATWEPDRVQDTRVVYLDQYSGAVLGDVGFKDWGPVGKAIEWGIAVHQGQEYGPINRYVMLLGCIAIVLMAVSAVTMWWKRRPAGSLGIPRRPVPTGAMRGLVVIMTVVGAIFPLVGASLLVAFGIDRALLTHRSVAVGN